MKSLLEALKEGRLIELPECDKEAALELLAHLIEAIPDIGTKNDLMQGVMEREAKANTGLGRGVACPHARSGTEGELHCAVGWSPHGIDYGAPDGKPVHLLIMYFVPDSGRNSYLKEISGLAKAISVGDTIETISRLPDIQSVREKFLDWVGLAINASAPDAKVRMIKLEAHQALAAGQPVGSPPSAIVAGSRFVPFRLVAWQGGILVLSNEPGLSESLEGIGDLAARLTQSRDFELPGWRIALLSETLFASDRKEYSGVAIALA
jgi:mannitol/fructose-specific phosphotransferase system IIA component (Ntr-type)